MNTLILPCAGRSSRFPNVRPKWMLYYPDNTMMVEKAVSGLNLNNFDRVIITIVKDHAVKYKADEILEDIFKFSEDNKFELCILDDYTSCQAETIYQTVKKCGVSGGFTVKDSDNYIDAAVPTATDYVVGLNMHTYKDEIERLAAKSFLVVNDQGIITDIIEKKIISEYISIGMYGFRDADIFCDAYTHLSSSKDLSGEIYISHVISYLIGMKKSVYEYVEATGYEDYGTLKDWYKILNLKKTYLVNTNNIIVEKQEKYGPNRYSDDPKLIQKNVDFLKLLSEQGAQIIVLSDMDKTHTDPLINVLKECGVTVFAAIADCYLSHQVLIKEFSPDIPCPACESINVTSDTDLKDVLPL